MLLTLVHSVICLSSFTYNLSIGSQLLDFVTQTPNPESILFDTMIKALNYIFVQINDSKQQGVKFWYINSIMNEG